MISLFSREVSAAPAPAGAALPWPAGSPPAPAITATGAPAAGALHSIDGIPHYLSASAAAHLLALARDFELVWASGWEEKADEYLPHLLGVPAGLPFLRFDARAHADTANGLSVAAHWKLQAVEGFAKDRALAWIDDAFNDACHDWAAARTAPTLLVETAPERGLTDAEALQLREWAAGL